LTDEELISAILEGNPHLFSEIVDRYKEKIYHMAYRFTNGHRDCQDLSQEIFLLIYRSLPSFRSQSSLSTWIYRLSINRCLDWCRKHKHLRRLVPLRSQDEEGRGADLDRIPANLPTPEAAYIQKEQDQSLHLAIAQLPEKYKTVIIMYHFQNLSYKEIGDILSLPVRTVETQLYRAKKKLKEILDKEEGGKRTWNAKEYNSI
jgi:RNA polymerase sigma-70 factor (ECF subfamily)